jgi:sodium/potassium/calcium exchanger 6
VCRPFEYYKRAYSCIGAGFFLGGTKHELRFVIAAAMAGLAMAILVAVFADEGNHPTSRMARCSMGFLVAIVWIMAIADEVVNVLQVLWCFHTTTP